MAKRNHIPFNLDAVAVWSRYTAGALADLQTPPLMSAFGGSRQLEPTKCKLFQFHRVYWHRLLPQNPAGSQMGSTLMRPTSAEHFPTIKWTDRFGGNAQVQ